MKTLLFFLLIFAGINCQAQKTILPSQYDTISVIVYESKDTLIWISYEPDYEDYEDYDIGIMLPQYAEDDRPDGFTKIMFKAVYNSIEKLNEKVYNLEKKVNILYNQHIKDSIKLRRIVECPDMHWIDDDIIDDFDNGFFPKIDSSLNYRLMPLNKL